MWLNCKKKTFPLDILIFFFFSRKCFDVKVIITFKSGAKITRLLLWDNVPTGCRQKTNPVLFLLWDKIKTTNMNLCWCLTNSKKIEEMMLKNRFWINNYFICFKIELYFWKGERQCAKVVLYYMSACYSFSKKSYVKYFYFFDYPEWWFWLG